MFTELNLIQPSHFMDGEIGIQGSHIGIQGSDRTRTSFKVSCLLAQKFSPYTNMLTVMCPVDGQSVLMVDNSILYYGRDATAQAIIFYFM